VRRSRRGRVTRTTASREAAAPATAERGRSATPSPSAASWASELSSLVSAAMWGVNPASRHALQHHPQAAPVRERDQGVAAQPAEVDPLAAGEVVAGASRENERFDVDHASADTRRQRLAGDADDRGVHLAAGDRFQQLVVVPLAEDDLDRWVRAVKVAEHPEDPPVDRRSHDPDRQCRAPRREQSKVA
jgi:hypothetical protein